MRNFVPKSDDDILPLELKTQFETLQHVLLEKKQHHSGVENEVIDCTCEDTMTKMALSTAISVQREIDGLLNGIVELENMLNDDKHSPESDQRIYTGSSKTETNSKNLRINPRKNVEKEGSSVIK